MLFFIKGVILGFSIAAPVGPIGILCIRRSLAKGHLSGFVTGLGAAAADTLYGIVASFGLTFISSFLIRQQVAFQAIGMVFLFYLGLKTLIEKPGQFKEIQTASTGLLNDFFSTLILTITNPVTILFFAAAFAGLGLSSQSGDFYAAGTLVADVFCGSAVWWFILSYGAGFFRKKTSERLLHFINRISGIILLLFAVVLLLHLLGLLYH